MSRKKARPSQQPHKARPTTEAQRKVRSRRKSVVVVALILSLGLTSLILAGWGTLRRSFSPIVPVPTPTPSLSASNPSKEYIYAGGKLVATEEPSASPTPTPTVFAPSNLTATAQFSNQALTGVLLHWSSPSVVVDHFRVERAQNKNGPWVVPPLPDPGANDTTLTDTTASLNVAYLYRICGVDAQGHLSAYSNLELSTTVWFVDDPLKTYAEDHNATPIKAAHFTQLRAAVNAVRRLVDPNTTDFNWSETGHQPQTGGGIYASHLTDLRTNLGTALAALTIPTPTYTYQTITPGISAIHRDDIKELRDAVR